MKSVRLRGTTVETLAATLSELRAWEGGKAGEGHKLIVFYEGLLCGNQSQGKQEGPPCPVVQVAPCSRAGVRGCRWVSGRVHEK